MEMNDPKMNRFSGISMIIFSLLQIGSMISGLTGSIADKSLVSGYAGNVRVDLISLAMYLQGFSIGLAAIVILVILLIWKGKLSNRYFSYASLFWYFAVQNTIVMFLYRLEATFFDSLYQLAVRTASDQIIAISSRIHMLNQETTSIAPAVAIFIALAVALRFFKPQKK